MNIITFITILGLSITFTENPKKNCNYYEHEINGCFFSDKNEIVLSLRSDDLDRTLWHEVGHAIFLKDDFSRIIIKDYPIIREVNKKFKNNELLDENIADYFALFILKNKEFSVKYPILYIYFRDKLKKLKIIY